MRIVTRRPASLTPSEMLGTWAYHEFEIEEGAAGPTRHGFATSTRNIDFQAGGNIFVNGAPEGTFTIDARRHVLLAIDGEVLDFGVTNAKDVAVSTSSEADHHVLRVLVRLESGASLRNWPVPGPSGP